MLTIRRERLILTDTCPLGSNLLSVVIFKAIVVNYAVCTYTSVYSVISFYVSKGKRGKAEAEH